MEARSLQMALDETCICLDSMYPVDGGLLVQRHSIHLHTYKFCTLLKKGSSRSRPLLVLRHRVSECNIDEVLVTEI